MVLRRVGAVGDAEPGDVLASAQFSSEAAGVDVSGEMPDHGTITINSPGDIDSLSSGHYASINNSIDDQGNAYISDPGDISNLDSGYYSGFTNGIANRGYEYINSPNDIDNLNSGYYSGFSNRITEHGYAYINSPGEIDNLNSGYYSGFRNRITTRGTASISSPSDIRNLNSGYYSGFSENIPDRGSIGDLSPGDYGQEGWYDQGSVTAATAGVIVRNDGTWIENSYIDVSGYESIFVDVSGGGSGGSSSTLRISTETQRKESWNNSDITLPDNVVSDLRFDVNSRDGTATVTVDGETVGADGGDSWDNYDEIPTSGSVSVSGGEDVGINVDTGSAYWAEAEASVEVDVGAGGGGDVDANISS